MIGKAFLRQKDGNDNHFQHRPDKAQTSEQAGQHAPDDGSTNQQHRDCDVPVPPPLAGPIRWAIELSVGKTDGMAEKSQPDG
jgi:hypothetical protein